MLSKNQNIINGCLTEDVNVENTNNSSNLSDSLKNLKIKNSNRFVFGNLNINTINNTFEQLKHIIKNNVDVLVVTETKLDSSFPFGQFSIDGFARPFRRDRNKNGGGVMIFVRDDIPSKEIKISFLPSDMECLFIEINIKKTKWLIVGCYHPPSQNDNYFFYNLSKALDSLNSNYEKFLLVGDFNSEDHETEITNFLNNHEAKNIVKQKTFSIPRVLICLLQTALKVFNIHMVFLVVFLIIIIFFLLSWKIHLESKNLT